MSLRAQPRRRNSTDIELTESSGSTGFHSPLVSSFVAHCSCLDISIELQFATSSLTIHRGQSIGTKEKPVIVYFVDTREADNLIPA
jgi:hypothetical protein